MERTDVDNNSNVPEKTSFKKTFSASSSLTQCSDSFSQQLSLGRHSLVLSSKIFHCMSPKFYGGDN